LFQRVIVNLKDLITIPVGSMNTLKEFCSQACLSIYKDRYEDAPVDLFTHCSVCKLVKEVRLIIQMLQFHFFVIFCIYKFVTPLWAELF